MGYLLLERYSQPSFVCPGVNRAVPRAEGLGGSLSRTQSFPLCQWLTQANDRSRVLVPSLPQTDQEAPGKSPHLPVHHPPFLIHGGQRELGAWAGGVSPVEA